MMLKYKYEYILILLNGFTIVKMNYILLQKFIYIHKISITAKSKTIQLEKANVAGKYQLRAHLIYEAIFVLQTLFGNCCLVLFDYYSTLYCISECW